MDGAGPFAMFFFIILPHLGRAISVVIMIETIFLLSVFAEIYVTTSGGPGLASTNLAFLIYLRALARIRRRRGLGCGRDRGDPGQYRRDLPRPFDRQEHRRLRARPCIPRPARSSSHTGRLAGRRRDLLSDLLDDPDELQDRGRGDRDAAQAVLHADPRELHHRARARRLRSFRPQQHHHLRRRHIPGNADRRAGGLCHGLLPGQADQGSAALDALDQDDAGGRRPDPDLPAVPRYGRDRHALGSDRGLHAHEPADRGVDALHLLQGGAEGHPRGGPHGRGQAEAGSLDAADATVSARHRIHGSAVDHPVLERSVLEPQPHHLARRRR